MAKSYTENLSFKSVTDTQTDKKLTFLAAQAAGELQAQANGIEDLEHVLALLKHSGVRCTVLQLGGAENLGEPRLPQLKPP